MSPMLTAGIDHVGLTVPDLSQAVSTLRDLLEGGLCYIEGPIEEPEPGWMVRKLGTSRAFTLRVAAMNVGGVNLELFEYAGGPEERQQPSGGELSGLALLVERSDVAAFNHHLAGFSHQQLDVSQAEACAWLSCGLQVVVRKADRDRVVPMLVLGPGEFENLVPDLLTLFNLKEERSQTVHGQKGVELRGTAGTSLVVVKAGNTAPTLPNNTPGAYHVAFHADDVDAAAGWFAKAGYRPFGTPETITKGPIAGDRWVYLGSPSGLQFELINMPDGALPYEALASCLRTPISKGMRQ